MINKIKENLGLAVTVIALMGSVGAGLRTAGDIVSTLSNIDERMNGIEMEFDQLKQETMVSNDIAVLYEKIYALEQTAQDTERFNEQMAYLSAEIENQRQQLQTLKIDTEQALSESGMDLSNKKLLEQWEWSDAQAQIIRIDTILQQVQQDLWNLDSLDTRIAYLEANLHGH
tara:strand:+ start:247 stop:762 length:516 start_codon:yes stop_codon:yes gene_type:complete